MASEADVKRYLAYWFQLGKRVLIKNGEESLRPQSVIQGSSYSQEFEGCWQQIISPDSGDCYLEGTSESIAELLTPIWEVTPCSRCSMPIPVRHVGMPALSCPCHDLPSWPNTEVPQPRSPVDTNGRLFAIRDRLLKVSGL